MLADLRRLVERTDGKLDIVEERIEWLEKRWLPHTRVDTPSTAKRVTGSTANTDRATITLPNSVLAAASASAALSTTATGRTTIVHHSFTTSAASISLLATTRSSPPPMAQQAPSTTSQSPLPSAAAARPAFLAVALAFRPHAVPALRDLPPTATDALRCPSGRIDGLLPASDASYDNEHWHRRAYLRPHLAPPTPPPLSASPAPSAATATASAENAGPAQLRAAAGPDGDYSSRSAVPLPSPTAAEHPNAHGYSFSLSYHGRMHARAPSSSEFDGEMASRYCNSLLLQASPSHAHH